jgi:hypothetical protein
MEVPKTATARKALKVAELKVVLGDLGLDTDGIKAVLLERLEQHVTAGDAAADEGATEVPVAEPPVEPAQEQPVEQVRPCTWLVRGPLARAVLLGRAILSTSAGSLSALRRFPLTSSARDEEVLDRRDDPTVIVAFAERRSAGVPLLSSSH